MAVANPDRTVTLADKYFQDVLEKLQNFNVLYEFEGDIDFLLIGKTGNGKSSTGNSILLEKKFVARGDFESVTTSVQQECSLFKNRQIKVVDGPGLADTRGYTDDKKAMLAVQREMQDAINFNTRGYHAFLLIIKYGNRMTDEEKQCIKLLKAIFGEDFIKKYSILVVTGGDNFEKDNPEEKKAFKTWCTSQKDPTFQELYKECGQRAVLFNNSTSKREKKVAQLKKLIKIVDEMPHDGKRFADSHFESAGRRLEQTISPSKSPLVRQNVLEKLSLILEVLFWICQQNDDDQTSYLNQIHEGIVSLLQYIKEKHNKFNELNGLIIIYELSLSAILEHKNKINKLIKKKGRTLVTEEELCLLRKCKREKEQEYRFQKNKYEKSYLKAKRSTESQHEKEIKSMEEAINKEKDKQRKTDLERQKKDLAVQKKVKLQELKKKKKDQKLLLRNLKDELLEKCKEYEDKEKNLKEQDYQSKIMGSGTNAAITKKKIQEEYARKFEEIILSSKEKYLNIKTQYERKKRKHEERIRKSCPV